MKKRIIAFILLACMLICSMLTGCDNGGTNSTNAPYIDTSVNLEGDPLIVYCYGFSEQTSNLIEKYNKHCAIYGDYNDRIEVIRYTEFSKFNSAVTTELMAGKGPDVFFLDSPLPFEKMTENGSLLDINELIKGKDADIDFADYNKVIMDAGVFEGKRYILPVFYCVDTFFSTQDRVDALGIDPDTITYRELADIKESGKNFIFADNTDNYGKERLLHCIIRQFADFEEKKTYFDTEEFASILDSINTLYEGSEGAEEDYFFENTDILTKSTYSYNYYGASPQSVSERYILQQEAGKELILFPAYSREGKVSAYIEAGIAVNANTEKTDKVMKLIEFLLSDKTQSYHCGALSKERLYTYSTCSLPVKNSILDKAFQVELEDNTYSSGEDTEYVDPELLKQQDVINENKNRFLRDEFRPLVDSIEECTLFYCREPQQSYYILNIAQELTDKYLQGTITKEKFIAQLDSATKAYMTE
ncbi:MAG: carbohydrate ABC transporter substrate-binding protein [Ruminococcus sp.]|nr:carbohydrate ABC transporter substrate-binding protein [Ruminococcus sp.]